MTKRVTLKDIASEVGVSYQTVSKVLNGQGNVTAETEAQIRHAVEKLGYRTNATARNLRKQASHLIGYSWTPMPPDRVNPILDRFLSSVADAAEAAGFHLLLFPTHDLEKQLVLYQELARSGRVDGFVLTGTNYDDPRIELLQTLQFPFVAFGRANPEWSFPYVDVDGRDGLRQATAHLIEQGHERVAILAWPENSRAGTARLNGYMEAMAVAGLPVDASWLVRSEGNVEAGYAQTTALLALPASQRPTAVVAVDDLLAIGALQAAQAASLVIGAEFGVTGFDDTPGIQHLTPSLTSVRQPIWEVGQQIVPMLIALTRGETLPETEITLSPQLIVRKSSLRR